MSLGEDNYGTPDTIARRRLRRVVIEERQAKTLEHVRSSLGYADEADPHGHDHNTFRLINRRKELDRLPGADFVVPGLDDWKHWTKMNDWDSRNRLLEQLIDKLRRREASPGEMQLLLVVCRPTWAAVAASLRRYGGVDLADDRADGRFRREEARRVNELDRAELDQVVQHALLDALRSCPRPFPRRFFPWLKEVLAYRALDHVRAELGEHDTTLPEDTEIKDVLDSMLCDERARRASFFAQPAAPGYSQWLCTFDLPKLFELAEEYAPYARTRSACERAVDRLPDRQKQVIQAHYFEATTQAALADVHGIAASTVRNTHRGALTNLRRDDALFQVLDAVGKVRDQARRLELESRLEAA
jgi:RNA polymerase sigma factor (sigma-70 family)